MRIKVNANRLPKPPCYSTVHLPKETENNSLNIADSKDTSKKRDWSKVRRGINHGEMGRPRFYTPAQDAVIKQLKAEGRTFKEIGDQLGKSKEAIRRRWYTIRR